METQLLKRMHIRTVSAPTAPDVVHLVLVPQPQLTWTVWSAVSNAISFVQKVGFNIKNCNLH